jgi:nitronate monooxygenase
MELSEFGSGHQVISVDHDGSMAIPAPAPEGDGVGVTHMFERLGAEIPVVAAPMAGGPSTPELVAAAAAAGGLGYLAGGYKSSKMLAAQITDVRSRTGVFGVNLFAPAPLPVDRLEFERYAAALAPVGARFGVQLESAQVVEDSDCWEEKVDLLVAEPVPVVSFTFAIPPGSVIERFKRSGSLTAQTITTVREAVDAEDAGIDLLLVQGLLAGGHSATTCPERVPDDVPLTDLVAQVRDATDLPVWAGGGIGSAEDVSAVLASGAEAAIVGSLLLRTSESGASRAYKNGLTAMAGTETVLTRAFSGRLARGIRNAFIDQFDAQAPSGYPAVHHLTSPLRRAAAEAGDWNYINLWAGGSYEAASDGPAGDVMRRLAGR